MALNVRQGIDAAGATEKYFRRTASAGADWLKGFLSPRRSPKAALIAANGKWKDRMQNAIATDALLAGANKINEDEMAASAQAGGAQAYQQGIANRKARITRIVQKNFELESQVSEKIQGLPQNTPQDRENRMVENLRSMRGLKGQAKA